MKQLERTRTIAWEDPMPAARAGAGLAGIDFLNAVRAGEIAAPPMAALMGFGIAAIESGRVVFTVEPAEYHYNPIGIVHGGLAATLCDSAMGCAVHSTLPAGAGYTTLELKINFVRPMTSATGTVTCEGRVIHGGGRVATAEAHVRDAEGRLYAHATSTCMILRGA